MKKILIVGPNSYVAKNFISLLPAKDFLKISVRGDDWQTFDYTIIDTIIYFAAIVHHPEIKEESLYINVNAYIPFNLAKLAKEQGVRKFIYISSVAVYGNGPKFGRKNEINCNTPLLPSSLYGKSKLKGEELLRSINDMIIQIVRLPNVYGENCPGTFYQWIKLLSKLRWLPIYRNKLQFSLISVDNVSKALLKLISINESGIFIPQDYPILAIVDRIGMLANLSGNKQCQATIFWPIIWIANKILPKKYTDNLYGGYYINPNEFPVLTD